MFLSVKKLNIFILSLLLFILGTIVFCYAEEGHIHRDVDLKWNWDNEYHYYLCSCGQVFDKGKHHGGTATCVKQATCDECYKKYGSVDPHNHTGKTYLKDYKEPTCGAPGYTGDIYCESCNGVVEYGTEIPATGLHEDADGKFEYDGEKHFHTCSCGAIFDEDYHTGGKATCASGAHCEVCNGAYGETNKRNHSGNTEVKNQKIATSEEDGYTGDTYCADCGVLLETGKKVIAPQILSGSDSVFNREKTKDLSFKSTNDFSDFIKVMVDGNDISEDDFTVMPSSTVTVVTLKVSYLESLSNGKHKIEIYAQKGIGNCYFYVTKNGDISGYDSTTAPKETDDNFEPTPVPVDDNDSNGMKILTGIVVSVVILIVVGLVLLKVLKKRKN